MATFKWSELTGVEKKLLNQEDLIFIAGSREMSARRIGELFAYYIKKGNILWGCLEEDYIEGFKKQPHFRTLKVSKLEKTLQQFEKFKLKNQCSIVQYKQGDICEILEIIPLKRALFINGSWKIVFHRRPEFEVLSTKNIPYKLTSPFVDDEEAVNYSKKIRPELEDLFFYETDNVYSDHELMQLAHKISKRSFDYTWQTGVVIAKEGKVLVTGHNKILPYETYSMHNGTPPERDKALLHQVTHSDAIHAEINALVKALNSQIDLEGTSLYINLLPCPVCAKAIAESKVSEVVYENDHFGGYGKELLERMGKKVRKLDFEN